MTKIIKGKPPRIVTTKSDLKRIDPKDVAAALGAKIVCSKCTVWMHRRAANHPHDHTPCATEGCGCFCHDKAGG
jgi:hypothetical protein